MRSSLVVAVVTVGMVFIAGHGRASEPAKTSTKPRSNAPATQTASAPAAATKDTRKETPPKSGPASVVATPADVQTPPQETLEETVARIQKRLAAERRLKKRVSAPPPAPARAETSERVTLVWRPYVVWPDDLTVARPEAASSDADRVTLKWDSDGQ